MQSNISYLVLWHRTVTHRRDSDQNYFRVRELVTAGLWYDSRSPSHTPKSSRRSRHFRHATFRKTAVVHNDGPHGGSNARLAQNSLLKKYERTIVTLSRAALNTSTLPISPHSARRRRLRPT